MMAKPLTKLALLIVGVLLISTFLLISPNPAVEIQGRPSAKDLQGARQVWRQLKVARAEGATDLHANNGMIVGLAALARDAFGLARLDARLSQGELRGRASIPLPLGLWLNASAAAKESRKGFPPIDITVGHVVLPTWAGRIFANLARRTFRLKGVDIPPLDDVVRSFSITGDQLIANVQLPTKTGLANRVIATRSRGVSRELVQATLCRISEAQRASPVQSLAQLAQRTFAEDAERASVESARASFVALSLAVVGDRTEALVPGGAELRMRCSFPDRPLLLHGRADLAKHWALSAALTAAFGAQTAENLGEWKELQDSLPDGSGFSFVDLAADRAGVQTAISALAPGTAVDTRKALSRATDEYMLPKTLLAAPEGLSNASFAKRFGGLEQRKYGEAVIQIDGMLRQQRLQQLPE